jgi:hypothetical protein
MNLGFTKKKLMSIILLLGCIFISLAMSHIPFLISNHKAGINIEGLEDGIEEDDMADDMADEAIDDVVDDAVDEPEETAIKPSVNIPNPVATTPSTVGTTPSTVVTTPAPVTPAPVTPVPAVTTKPLNACSSSVLLSAKLLLDNMDYNGARSILNSCS